MGASRQARSRIYSLLQTGLPHSTLPSCASHRTRPVKYHLDVNGIKLEFVEARGSGSLGITLLREELRKTDLWDGDDVAMLPTEKPNTFKLRLPPDDG